MGALLEHSGQIWAVAADLSAPLFEGGTLWYQRKAALDSFVKARA